MKEHAEAFLKNAFKNMTPEDIVCKTEDFTNVKPFDYYHIDSHFSKGPVYKETITLNKGQENIMRLLTLSEFKTVEEALQSDFWKELQKINEPVTRKIENIVKNNDLNHKLSIGNFSDIPENSLSVSKTFFLTIKALLEKFPLFEDALGNRLCVPNEILAITKNIKSGQKISDIFLKCLEEFPVEIGIEVIQNSLSYEQTEERQKLLNILQNYPKRFSKEKTKALSHFLK